MTHPDPVTDDTWPYPIPPTGPQTQPSGDDMPTPLPPPTPRTGKVHGYAAYARGCRCDYCRQAKAEYMRARRAAGRAAAQRHTASSTGNRGTRVAAFDVGSTRHIARVETHGTRAAYEEHGCRCLPCTRARTDSDARYRRTRSEVAS